MLLFIHLVLLALAARGLYRLYQESPLRLYFWPALALKLAAGLAMGGLYFFYYGNGDTLVYHQDASELATLARQNFPAYLKALNGDYPEGLELIYIQQERALLTAKVFSIFYIFTFGNYWVTSCYVSLLAFWALFNLAHRLVLYRPSLQKPAALAFLFWPSFVFWTSGLLKESLAIVCISYSVASVLPFVLAHKKLKLVEIATALPLLYFLFQIKYYYAALLLPVLFCLLLAVWVRMRFQLKAYWAWLIFIISLAGGVAVASSLHPNLYPSRFLEVWVHNYFIISEASPEGGFIVFEDMKAEWLRILQLSPEAVFSGLYQPLFLFERGHILRMVASAENCLLLLLSLAALFGWILKGRGRLSLPAFALFLYILLFALIMAIAAPNYGALLRYRISYLPFFVLLVLSGTFRLIQWLREKEKEGD